MKKITAIIFALFIGVSLNAQSAVEKYFEKYEDNNDFSTVYVSPKMFSMITKATSDADLKDLEVLKDLKGLTRLSTEKTPMKYYKEATKSIPLSEYDELVKVKENGSKVNIFTKSSGNQDVVKEVLVLSGSDKKFSILSFVGNIKLSDLNKLAKNLNIEGAEHLNKVKK